MSQIGTENDKKSKTLEIIPISTILVHFLSNYRKTSWNSMLEPLVDGTICCFDELSSLCNKFTLKKMPQIDPEFVEKVEDLLLMQFPYNFRVISLQVLTQSTTSEGAMQLFLERTLQRLLRKQFRMTPNESNYFNISVSLQFVYFFNSF